MDPTAIYEDLKEKIIWLDLEPGSTLNLVQLAESYGVSRNPVMIALTRLNVEEWVVRQGVHFVVSPLTVDRMREITEIRSVMEAQANIWAMNRITPEGMANLLKVWNEIHALNADSTKKEIVQLDFKFHQLLYRETRNQQLAKLLERLLAHYLRFWLSGPQEIDPETFFAEVLEIYEAIETKDEIRLKVATIAHVKVSLDKIVGLS
jgi:DNA-binding GntR family transcriptional regulator